MGKIRQYEENKLMMALDAIRVNNISLGKASRLYGIPKSTLGKYSKEGIKHIQKMGTQRLLSESEESSLAAYMRYCEENLLPFTYEILRAYARQILLRKGNDTSKLCHSWCQDFVRRHGLSARKARHVEHQRIAASSSPDVLIEYYELLLCQLTDRNLLDQPHRVWNMDEKGWNKQQQIQQPVLVTRGKPQAKTQQIVLNDHITTVHCINAAGRVLDPFLIFSKRVPTTFERGLPQSWIYACSESGYITSELFFKWFRDAFLPKIGRERPQVLIYDAASSHMSIDVIQLALKEDICIISLPGKTTAFLQPVDQLLSKLTLEFDRVSYDCCYIKSNFLVKPENFPQILKQALSAAWSRKDIQAAFARTGMFPPSLEPVASSHHLTDAARLVIRRYLSGDRIPSEDMDVANEVTITDEVTVQPGVSVEPGMSVESEVCLQDLCAECGRPTDDPCKSCILREKKRSNVLYRNGLIHEDLVDILDPPQSQAIRNKHKAKVTKAQYVTGEEYLKQKELKEKEKAEKEVKKCLRAKKRTAERSGSNDVCIRLDHDYCHQTTHKEHTTTKRRKRKPINYKVMDEGGVDLVSQTIDTCPGCRIPTSPDDDVVWYGCDFCPRWWHRHCLSGSILTNADKSVNDSATKFRCPACPENAICAACFGNISSLQAAQCHLCLAKFHQDCLPEQHQILFSLCLEQNREWACGQCNEE